MGLREDVGSVPAVAVARSVHGTLADTSEHERLCSHKLEGFSGTRGCAVWVFGDKGFEEGHRAWIGFGIFISVIPTKGIFGGLLSE